MASFACPECGRTFTRKDSLQRQIKKFHAIDSTPKRSALYAIMQTAVSDDCVSTWGTNTNSSKLILMRHRLVCSIVINVYLKHSQKADDLAMHYNTV